MATKTKTKTKRAPKVPQQMELKVPKIQGPVSPVMAIPKEVLYKSESEPPLENTMTKVLENEEYVQQNFSRRLKDEGKEFYLCPLCKFGVGSHFIKTTVAAHLKKEHKMKVKELKLTKAPKHTYQPKPQLQAPDPHLADFYPPHLREQMEAQQAAAKLLKPISDQARALSKQGSHLVQMVSMNENLAIQRLSSLNDADLMAVYQMASNRGKRMLARQAKFLCDKKNLNPHALKQPSEKARKIQETLMGAAFAASKRG